VVWNGLSYICLPLTKDGHIEHLWIIKKRLGEIICILV
jgi:hypothetical protein